MPDENRVSRGPERGAETSLCYPVVMGRPIAALTLLLALALSGPLSAQDGGLPDDLRAEADQARGGLCALYDVQPGDCAAPIAVRLAALPSDLPPDWAGLPTFAAGAADEPAGRILILLSRCGAYPFGDARQTLRHELSHVLLYRGLGFRPPRWLDEGLAMRAGNEWSFSDEVYSALALPAVARGSWRLERVEADFAGGEGSVRRSYALAKGFVRDLFKNDEDVRAFVKEVRRDRNVELAFLARFGMRPDAAFSAWAKNLPWWGEWLVFLTSPSSLWTLVLALFIRAAFAAWRRRRRLSAQLDAEEQGPTGPEGPWVQ